MQNTCAMHKQALLWRLAVGLAVALKICVASNPTDFLTKHWTTENGLPQNSVTAIAQTPDGFLWLGTFGGLVRFDGFAFTVFDSNNTPALKSNRITALYVDRRGKLWFGTDTCEVYALVAGGIQLFSQLAEGASQNFIDAIYEDTQGNLFVGTLSNGFFVFPQATASLLQHYDLRSVSPDNTLRAFCEDNEGQRWIAGSQGIFRYEAGKFPPPLERPKEMNSTIIALSPHPEKGLWVITIRHIWQFAHGTWRKYYTFPPSDFRHPTLTKGEGGNYWYGIESNQLFQLQADRVHKIPLPIASQYRTRALLEDREGNLWMGVEGDGLYQLRHRQVTMLQSPAIPPNLQMHTVLEDSTGQIWLGSNQGLFRLSGKQVTAIYNKAPTTPFGWYIHSLYQDREGVLWIGYQNSVAQYKNGRFTLNVVPGISNTNAIKQDHQGVMWFGTLKGLVRYQNGESKTYTPTEGLIHNDVRAIHEDRRGRIWVGTVGGLSCFHKGRFTNYTVKEGLSNEHIRDIYEDADGALWLATYGGGLNYLKDGRLSAITSRQGLFDNYVSRILMDAHDNFWYLGNRGIFSIPRQDLLDFISHQTKSILCASYGVADGMAVAEGEGGYQYAGWRMQDGKLWFPLIRGVAIVTPSSASPPPPPVFIETVSVDGMPVNFAPGIVLSPQQNSLEISYTGLCLSKPEQIQFQYKLDGYDTDWVIAGTNQSASYGKLPPGTYTFHVRAAYPQVRQKWQEVSLPIKVIPPVWRRPWFIILLLTAVLGLLYLGYRWRVGQLHRRSEQQQIFARQLIASQENERKRIAREIHDGLSQSQVIIKRRALAGLQESADPEQAKEQLAEIAEASSYAIDEVKEIIFALRPHQLDQLGLSAALMDLIARVALVHQWELTNQLENIDGLFSKEEENNLYRIVQEVLNNISKHAAATQVIVQSIRTAQQLELRITDNGKGFILQEDTVKAQQSLGFHSIIERTKLLGGQVIIKSAPAQGTTIQLRLPLGAGTHKNV